MEHLISVEISINGAIKVVPAKLLTRGGTKSPPLWLFEIDNRWVTPFEQKLKNINPTFHGAFKLVYYMPLKRLLNENESPFLNLIKPNKIKGDLYTIPVKLTKKHGINYD